MTESRPIKTVVAFSSTFAFGPSAFAWDPPIGIPEPEFGIEQTHFMYAGQPGYEDAGNGPYSHYIDNSIACTNTDNPNGTAANPRCSMPTTLEAGGVVEIHGGPYVGGDITWTMNGTPNQPVFIRGVGPDAKPQFTGSRRRIVTLSGTYGIVEYIEALDSTAIEIRGSNMSLRHSYVHEHEGKGNIVGVTGAASFVVIYGNEISNNGQIPSNADHHGVSSGANTDHVWIVDNHIHHNSGDGIQFCHGCIGKGNGPSNVYIGRNDIHDDEENAIDLKEFRGPVIVSENDLRNYQPGKFSGNGDAFRVNDEGNQGDVWILYNTISNSTRGIAPSRSDATVYVIGNVIWNVRRGAIGTDADFVINNTVYNSGTAIAAGEARGNIIVNNNTAIGEEVTGCSHNLIQRGKVRRNCSNTAHGDPRFVTGEDGRIIGIESTSPAIGAGFGNHAVYDTFETRFGLNIRVDINGTPRPVGQQWSAGAHEYVDSVPASPPTNQSNMQ